MINKQTNKQTTKNKIISNAQNQPKNATKIHDQQAFGQNKNNQTYTN